MADPAIETVELWMLVFGMKKEDNWTPLVREGMQQAEARAKRRAQY